MERTVGIEPHGIASLIICRSTTTTSLLLCRSQRLCLPWILDHWRIISAIEICNRRPDTLRLRRIDLRSSGRTSVCGWGIKLEGRIPHIEFSTWAFVFGITLAVLLIILAALVLWDVLR